MAYVFTQAANPQAIAELQWGEGADIMFTAFTSCIGLMGINGNNVIGVHLALRDANDQAVDNADIDAAIALLNNATQPVIIGATAIWEQAAPTEYHHLLTQLQPVEIYAYGDGTYGGEIVNHAGVMAIQPRYA
ncbi:hypothetical protein [Thalassospira sp.]|uniref:hypothetical protein n=1 Tax=Thalassospira sp. TaxID=1912094 RepID=UPI0027339035|nr:hypothetical protein [Thalassospira sp.]MDP2697400.1 hypothetical protein [Thalassospira sp.]